MKDARNGRQRKRKARKNTDRVPSKDVVVALVQQLSEKEKKMVKQHGIFLVRNFEKVWPNEILPLLTYFQYYICSSSDTSLQSTSHSKNDK